MTIRRNTCYLCGEQLETADGGYQVHPDVETCLVRYTDEYGVPLDEEPVIAEAPEKDEVEGGFFAELDITLFPYIEIVIAEVFANHGVDRLGGVSTGRGWSVFSTFQRCKYLYYRKYIEPIQAAVVIPGFEPKARAVGTMVHSLLAIYYSRMIMPDYPLTPERLRDECLKKGDPEIIHEGWRVFLSYALFYQGEDIRPLAVEFDLRDPRTNESCRFDLIAYFPEAHADRAAGTYNIEHKTSERFDDATLNGWANDGEVLGQMMLWKRMKLHLRFGELRGTIVNILGKQKECKFHRTLVGPETFQIAQHERDLRHGRAEMDMYRSLGYWPRSRANCIARWGKCDLYDVCATIDE